MPNEASELLKRKAGQIMRVWEERANNEVLAAYKLESLALRDSLPELLSQISDALSTTVDRTAARVRWDRKESLRIGRKHGQERAGSVDYTMDQMIFEYHILREVICDEMEEERLLSPVEREVIVCAVEQSVNDAATEFSDTLRRIQDRFASTLTHDLRNPILVAKMTAQLLLRDPGNAAMGTEAATRICESMDRLDAMIHELLVASVIRAGERLPLKIEQFDLASLTERCATEFNLIYDNRITLVIKSRPQGFWSKNGLRRVMENLVTNAVKYGDPSTPVTMTLEDCGPHVILSIHNEGKIIAPEEISIIFQHFRRQPSAENKSGWGLGLTVVKGVTEAHGGTVRVESSEDKGTTFIIQLPQDARLESNS